MFAHTAWRRAWLAVLLSATSAHAQFRSPQVAVAGSGLQDFLNAQGQAISVASEQRAAQSFAAINVGIPVSVSFDVRDMRASAWPLALYDLHAATPALHTIFPGASVSGWFTSVGFRTSPDRLVVNLFDAAGSLQGTTTYLGVELFAQGFALDGTPLGTVYSEDARNAGQQPRMLIFRGTGAHVSDAWLCIEADGDGDFDDAVYVLEFFAAVPAKRGTWAELKRLYR
jgi:hypothetical protein